MKIIKTAKSDVLDAALYNFFKEAQAKQIMSSIDDILAMLKGVAQGTDDYTAAVKQLIEFAEGSGPDAEKAMSALKEVYEQSPDVIKTVDPSFAQKLTSEVIQNVPKAIEPAANNILREEANKLITSAKNIDELADLIQASSGQPVKWMGKLRSSEELLELIKIERKKALAAKAALKQAEDAGRLSAENIKVLSDAAQIAEKRALDAENLLGQLVREVEGLASELTDAAKVIAELESQVGKLTSEQVKAVEESAKLSEQLGKYKALSESAAAVGEGKTLEYKALQEAIDNLSKRIDNVNSTVTAGKPPAAKEILEKAGATAKAKGSKAGKEAFDEAARETSEQAASKVVKETPSGTPKSKVPGTPDVPKTPAKPGPPNLMTRAKNSIIEKALPRLVEKGTGLVSKGIYSILSFGLLLGGGYLIYKYLTTNEPDKLEQNIQLIETRLNDSLAKLRALNYNPGTTGEAANLDLISDIEKALKLTPLLRNATKEQLYEISSALDEVYISSVDYLENSPAYSNDLATPEGFEPALESLRLLLGDVDSFKAVLHEVGKTLEERGDFEASPIEQPIGRPGGDVPGESTETEGAPALIDIYGQQIDISHTPPRFRSAAPALIKRVLNTPAGYAFVDPNNIWGGYITKTGDPKIDYLQSLKYIYSKGITNESQLKRYMREKLSRIGTKRNSGWREALSHYSNNLVVKKILDKDISKKSSKNISNNINSINKNKVGMRKLADDISNDYYQVALKGLEDNYAKSYYTGLKGMYDQKLGQKEADYKDLYDVHEETGPELIGSAHPESIDLVRSIGNGGRVENLVEQQRHNVGVALSTPTGNFRSKYAEVTTALKKLAVEAEKEKDYDVAKLIEQTIETFK